jgi:hypothetical protein
VSLAHHLFRNSDALVIRSLRDRLSSKLRLRRLVTRRNEAVLQYRKLAKASITTKTDELERAISEQLATIEQFNTEIEQLKIKTTSQAKGNAAKTQFRAVRAGSPGEPDRD